ncbi:efflux RND transporter periplasmic adaptor subunit [Sulfurivermis fontis]|jgi:multidrug efflux system membrane fusion protein|uniref:efflux RND transporter periplasmic adaptor subunit n=1 Tax=Sulfurivermis fontis TaxID=1972068 RepID=UPI000FDCD0E8|nr:efflux RND transporter periplasmic adaptor subunit [Sulfurivermis fontis]
MKMTRGILVLCGLLASTALPAGEVTGSLQWLRRVELSTPASGVISQVAVNNGDEVQQGQLLLNLDPRGFNALVRKAESRVLSAREARDEAKRELERTSEMYDRTLLSDHELQLAKIALSNAEAELQAAEAERTLARLELEYSRVTAPFDGVILERRAEVGQTVVTRMQSVPLLVLAETGRMLARVEVSEQELAALRTGLDVQVRAGNKVFQGKVQRVGMEPVIAAGGVARYEVDVLFEYPRTERLRAGQSAVVVLP